MSIVYVSPSGSDGSSGLTDRPVRTIAEAMRRVVADSRIAGIALERGGVWPEAFGALPRPLRIEDTFGAGMGALPRPVVEHAQPLRTAIDGPPMDKIEIEGIEFRAAAEAHVGLYFLSGGSGLTIRDCVVRGYTQNLVVQGTPGVPWRDVTIERCRVLDAFGSGGRGQGIYCEHTHGLTIRGCVVDHNGWRVPAETTMQAHGIYIHALCTGLVVEDNAITRNSAHGLQARCGGSIRRNLILRNACGLSCGHVEGNSPPTPGGVPCVIEHNAICEGVDIPGLANGTRGMGMELGNLLAGGRIAHNVVANTASALMYEPALRFWMHHGIGISELDVFDNQIRDWNEVQFATSEPVGDRVRFHGNRVQRVRFAGEPIRFRPLVDVDKRTEIYRDNEIILDAKASPWPLGNFLDAAGYESLRTGEYEPMDILPAYLDMFGLALPDGAPVPEPEPEPDFTPAELVINVPAGTRRVIINLP